MDRVSNSFITKLVLSLVAFAFMAIIFQFMNITKIEAATIYIRMDYANPSAGEVADYEWYSRSGDVGATPSSFTPNGQVINDPYNEDADNVLQDPVPPISPNPTTGGTKRVVRVYKAATSYDLPACATNITISPSGQGGNSANALRLQYRGNDGLGSNGAFAPFILDWPEARVDFYAGSTLKGLAAWQELGPNGAQDSWGDLLVHTNTSNSLVYTLNNMSISRAELSSGVRMLYYVETLDNNSNNVWIQGREFSFNTSGHPYLRVDYDDSACAWSVDAECTIDIINRRITYTVRRTAGTVPGNLNVALTSAPGSTGLTTPVTLSDTDFNNASNAWEYSYNVNPPPNLGQSIVGNISVTPGGNATASVSDSCNSGPIVARPYLRVYGHDTVAGLPFPDEAGVCGAKVEAKIDTYSRQVSGNTWVGSGSQFAASATDKIVGFISAGMHSGVGGGAEVTKPPLDLSFGNSSGGAKVAFNDAGDDETGYSGCLPDYLSYIKTRNWSIGNNTIGANTGGDSGQMIGIKGNLRISGDRDFNATYSSLGDLQNKRYDIIVVQGNINIDPGVSTLEGIYVAVPDPADPDNTGIINTCNYGSGPISSCDNKLTINGALIAKSVLFNRINGDVQNTGIPANEGPSSGNIAEVINFSPELFLMFSGEKVDSNLPNKGRYDSIVGLPPIL